MIDNDDGSERFEIDEYEERAITKLEVKERDKCESISWLKYRLRYQLAPGIHTYAQCGAAIDNYRDCNNGARGGTWCADCVTAELALMVGSDRADKIREEIEDRLNDKNN